MATLSESHTAWIYSVGRVSGWLVEVVIMYVILAFPTGGLAARVDRALVAATVLLVLFLYLPTALLVESYPVPTPWTDCGDGCPGNAFMVVASQPAFVGDVVLPLRDALIVALFVAVTARIAWRMRRRPAFPARARAGVGRVALPARRLRRDAHRAAHRADAAFVDVASWLVALTVPLLAVAFLVGVWNWRLFMASAMQRVATPVRAHPGPEALRAALADAFDDPSLDIVYWIDDAAAAGWTPPAVTSPPRWRRRTAR